MALEWPPLAPFEVLARGQQAEGLAAEAANVLDLERADDANDRGPDEARPVDVDGVDVVVEGGHQEEALDGGGLVVELVQGVVVEPLPEVLGGADLRLGEAEVGRRYADAHEPPPEDAPVEPAGGDVALLAATLPLPVCALRGRPPKLGKLLLLARQDVHRSRLDQLDQLAHLELVPVPAEDEDERRELGEHETKLEHELHEDLRAVIDVVDEHYDVIHG